MCLLKLNLRHYTKHAIWRSVLTQPNDFLVYMRNVHEIRGYNRLTLMSNAPVSVTLQAWLRIVLQPTNHLNHLG